jgi:hypothetical protein
MRETKDVKEHGKDDVAKLKAELKECVSSNDMLIKTEIAGNTSSRSMLAEAGIRSGNKRNNVNRTCNNYISDINISCSNVKCA